MSVRAFRRRCWLTVVSRLVCVRCLVVSVPHTSRVVAVKCCARCKACLNEHHVLGCCHIMAAFVATSEGRAAVGTGIAAGTQDEQGSVVGTQDYHQPAAGTHHPRAAAPGAAEGTGAEPAAPTATKGCPPGDVAAGQLDEAPLVVATGCVGAARGRVVAAAPLEMHVELRRAAARSQPAAGTVPEMPVTIGRHAGERCGQRGVDLNLGSQAPSALCATHGHSGERAHLRAHTYT